MKVLRRIKLRSYCLAMICKRDNIASSPLFIVPSNGRENYYTEIPVAAPSVRTWIVQPVVIPSKYVEPIVHHTQGQTVSKIQVTIANYF